MLADINLKKSHPKLLKKVTFSADARKQILPDVTYSRKQYKWKIMARLKCSVSNENKF